MNANQRSAGNDGKQSEVELTGDTTSRTRTIKSGELLGGRREALIEHEGKMYRLQATRNGKLILTK